MRKILFVIFMNIFSLALVVEGSYLLESPCCENRSQTQVFDGHSSENIKDRQCSPSHCDCDKTTCLDCQVSFLALGHSFAKPLVPAFLGKLNFLAESVGDNINIVSLVFRPPIS
jgi:hypothetical protein